MEIFLRKPSNFKLDALAEKLKIGLKNLQDNSLLKFNPFSISQNLI